MRDEGELKEKWKTDDEGRQMNLGDGGMYRVGTKWVGTEGVGREGAGKKTDEEVCR